MSARLHVPAGLATATVAAAIAVMLPASPASQGVPAAGPRPLPSEEFLADVRANLARSDREQYRYAYKERRSELHTNPFGRLGTDGLLLYDVTPGKEVGVYFKQLIERDGERLEGETPQRVDRRNKPEENRSVHDVLATLTFEVAGRERRGGRDHVLVRFAPRDDARPKTRQGRIAKVFKGTAWIDETDREVARIEATAIDDVSFGWGIVARIDDGAKATLIRERVEDGIWLPTSIRLSGEGRAILFRKLDLDFFIEYFDYQRTPG